MNDVKETLKKLSREQLALLSEKLKEKSVQSPQQAPHHRIEARPNRFAPCPLSFAQQRLWFIDRLNPGSPLYNIPGSVRREGYLNLDTLERVINEIVRRHEVLRTRFEVDADEPVQVIDQWEPRRLEVIDLTNMTPESREEAVRRFVREEAETGFDLSRGPLLRVKVLKLEEDVHLLLYTMHHVVSDAWSMDILMGEVGALYRAYSLGEESPLPELEIQYADFAVWQRTYLTGEVLEKEVGYWRERLKDAAQLELPADRPRPAEPSYRGGLDRLELSPAVSEGLRRLSRQEGATLFMTLMAALKVVLMRHSGQEDISVGTVIANRTRKEVEGLIGFFVNTLVMRTDLSGNQSFGGLLRRERETALGAYAHQELPFEKLVEDINPERDLGRSPLFQALMTLQQAGPETSPPPRANLSEVSATVERVGAAQFAKFDLTLSITDRGKGLTGAVLYSRDLFEAGTIERLIDHYKNVLEEVVKDSERPIWALELLSKEERKQIVEEWNETQAEHSWKQCVHSLFEAQAGRAPDAVAVVFGSECMSYGELEKRANQLANHLRTLGVGIESRVGVCVGRSVEMVESVLGTLKAGGVCVPLDPGYPVERLKYMVRDAGVEWVVTVGEAGERLLEGSEAKFLRLDLGRERIETEALTPPQAVVDPDNIIYVIYTSGSTGVPKGVALSHAALVNLICWDGTTLLPQSRMLQFSSLNFDASFHELFLTWAFGGTIVLITLEQQRDPRLLSREIRDNSIESLNLPAAVIDAVLEELAADGFGAVRELISTAEQMQIAPRWWEKLKQEGCAVWNHYGPSESHVITAWQAWSGALGDLGRPPIGKPIANCRTYVLNNRLQPAPVGAVGELYLGGIGIARGYLNRPEQTAERFTPDPHSSCGGERVYRTGDLARYLNDGNVEYLGRIDHQVKIRGYRVELGEVEVALRQQPGIEDAVVAMREGPSGDKRLVAYVVAERGENVKLEALRGALREKLPDYMIPGEWVEMDRFPLTANGKVDRRSLPEPESRAKRSGTDPRTQLEEIVAGIWSEVLKLEKVRVDENFFDLGGQSLLATRVASRVRKMTGVEIGVRVVFEEKTVRGMARRIEEALRDGKKDDAPPLVRVSRDQRLPLSFAQQRLWFIDQLEPGSPLYNIPGVIRLKGGLDLVALERVTNEVVRRHEALRTRFEVDADEPVQVIDQWEPRRLEVIDLTNMTPESREEAVRRFVREEAGTRFDLSRGPLLRVKVLKLEEDVHLALYTMHHIVSDGWSIEILMGEVGALYRAYSLGEESPLPELEIQYADFAVWQRAYLTGEVLEKEVGYWREQLKDAAQLELPADRPRPAEPSYRGGLDRLELSPAVSEGLRRLSRQEGATLFMTLMAALKVVLMRHSGQEDISVGTAIANRTRKEVEGLIGFFINTLVVRTDLSGNPSFKESLGRERARALGAYAHQELPFEKLVEELNPERDLSRNPLSQVMMVLQNVDRETLELPGVNLSEAGATVETGGETQTAKFDLTLVIRDLGPRLVGGIEYSRDLFEAATIERLIRHYTNVLEEVVKDRERLIWSLDLLSEEERKQIVEEWNATETDYPGEKLIHELFEEQVERSPDAVALVHGDQSLTYIELNSRANRLAHYLRRLGVGPEARVGICFERGREMMVALLATLKAGAAYLPLDPAYPSERLRLMLEDGNPVVALTQGRFLEVLPDFRGEIVCLDRDDSLMSEQSEENPPSRMTGEDLAYVIYTSGSTGRPKGVMGLHRGAINRFSWMWRTFPFTAGEAACQKTSLNFIDSVWEIFGPLLQGVRTVIVDDDAVKDIAGFARILHSEQVSRLVLVPSLLRSLLESIDDLPGGLGELKYCISSGEALSPELSEAFSSKLPESVLLNLYGSSEVTADASWQIVGGSEKRSIVPIGGPIANTQIYLLNSRLQPAPVGVQAEIHVGGHGLARNYLNHADLTAEKFIPNPYSGEPGARLYRTGDLGRYLADGKIEYAGRIDHQVKIRGFRVELGEIESHLRTHAGVSECVVIARNDEMGETRLVAYVVREVETELGVHELRDYLKGRLPEYMLPARFIWLERMPATPSGKVDRRSLPAPERSWSKEMAPPIERGSQVEEIVIGIFEEVLKVDRVGRKDNFFELGGHSLLATRAIARVMKMMRVELSVRSVFENPTAEDLSRRIEEALRAGKKDEAPPLVRVSRERRLPLSFAQQRLWFIDQLEPGSALYNIPGAIRLDGRLDLVTLERSLNETARRHEVLRTRIVVESGEPAQVIEDWEPRRLEVVDLSGLSREERNEEVRRRAREEAETGFDLSLGPLLRVKVLKLEEEEYFMLYTMSHMVSDGWSMGILIREVKTLYQAYSEDEEAPLPELEIQYADFAVWQREYLAGGVLEKEVGYWREQLKDAAVLELPADRSRPPEPTYRGSLDRVNLGHSVSEGLRRLSRREGATLFMTLMAAFKILLMRYSGQEDIVVGTAIANRTRKEVEGLIGFFVNTLVMRTDLSGNPSFRELLRRESAVALGAYAHQELPFEKLVEELNPERDLSRNPLFQVMMSLQNAGTEGLKPERPVSRGLEKEKTSQNGILESTWIGAVKFDMELLWMETRDGIACVLEYGRDLFEPETIRRMARHYEKLLEEVSKDAEQTIREIELLSGAEREQILIDWNQTEQAYPRDLSIRELFEAQVERAPEAAAVVFGDQILTYQELNARANRMARALIKQGVGPEVLVAVLAERGTGFLITMLAIFKAGGAYIPLDPHHPTQRIAQALSLSGAAVVVAASERKSLAADSIAGLTAEILPAVLILEDLWENDFETDDLGQYFSPRQLAYVIFTSGSTGIPKGAMVEHRGMLNHLFAKVEDLALDENDVVAQTASQCFDISVWQFLAALLVGGRIQIFDDQTTHDPAGLLDQIEQREVTILEIVPSIMRILLAAANTRPVKPGLATLRWMIPTGEALAPDLCRDWFSFYPEIPLLNAYGPTECSDDVTHCPFEYALSEIAVRSPIGRPIANTQIYVLDGVLNPQPIGIVGELYVGGDGVGRGYLNEAGKTAESFAPALFMMEAGARMYRSGDLARYLSDGNLEYLGRIDHQVKIRGFRIELGEIEAALREHGAVKQAVVEMREDRPGEKQLVAYVVTERGEREKVGALRSALRDRLPDYMTPTAYVTLDALPLTPNGKLDRKALPAPDMWKAEERNGYPALLTPLEQIVVGIFEEVLKLDQVGRKDNFFELGGHSLLATQVISRVRKMSGVELGVRSIFEKPTAEDLSRRLEEALRAGKKNEAPPLVRVSRERRLPLSFAQQRLWFLDQLDPGSVLYNIPRAIRLENGLDLAALERSVNEIVRRHEVLRTRIVAESGQPAQVIDAWEPRRLEVVDLTSLSQEEKKEEVSRRAREESETEFDLSLGPLFRVKVLKLEEEDHIVLYTMHHIVSDGWSMRILSGEMEALYQAYLVGEPSPLPELEIQYADFAVWQRAWLQGSTLEKELEYWRNQLHGLEDLKLPTDHPRPAARSYRGANRRFVIDGELADRLRALGRREGATLFMTILGGFDVLMSQYGGGRDVTLGTDIANRNWAETEGLIGFFVNQLALRVEVRTEENFSSLLKRVRETCLGAYAHQDLPFEKLVEELRPERDLSRSPLFQVKLIMQDALNGGPRLRSGGLRNGNRGAAEAPIEEEKAKLDLTIIIIDEGHDLVGVVEYSRDLFDVGTIDRLMNHYGNALKGIAEDSERPISDLNLLSEEERAQIVVEWNKTDKSYSPDLLVHEIFEEQAERSPERIALIGAGQAMSYGELNRRANQLGNYLQGLGVGPEAVVGLCIERSVEMAQALLGTLKAGGAYLPLDPDYPLERLSFMLEDAGVGVVLTERKTEGRLPAFWGQTVCLDTEWEAISGQNEVEPASEVDPGNLAYVIYTSGSTGKPKGAMVSHRGVSNLVEAQKEIFGIGCDSHVLQFASLSFDASVWEIFGALGAGRSLHVYGRESLGPGEDLLRVLKEEQITMVTLPPSVLGALGEVELKNLETVVAAGEACTTEIVERWAGGRRFLNAYGPTEATVCASVGECKAGGNGRPGIGRPINNTKLYILDGRTNPTPVGTQGELYIAGVGLARGYVGRAELTAERFIPDQFNAEGGGRLYRTGDVVRHLANGEVEFIGRSDDQVKVRGRRIELGEIVAALNEHRSVKQSVVVAIEDETGNKRLIGYVVGEERTRSAELKRYLRERLPEYMVPEAVVALKQMPLTANGKIDRRRLPSAQSLRDASRQAEQEYVAPRTPLEEIVVGIFEEVLRLDRIGRRENFFELGGHSLLVIQVISRVRDIFEIEIGPRNIFDAPTAEALSRNIDEALRAGEKASAPPLVRAEREGAGVRRAPLSFAQQRLWFIDELNPGSALYNIPGAVRLKGGLSLEALERSVNEIVKRHEVLRTRFEVEAGEPAQVIDEWTPYKLDVEDLTGLPPQEREAEVRKSARDESVRGFDLSCGPLLRVKVLKVGKDDYILLYAMHHIISDEWSQGILIREMETLYQAYLEGEESPLPELEIQYADYAVWQRSYLSGEVLDREIRYWREQLKDAAVLELPADRPRPAEPSYRGAVAIIDLDVSLSDGLRRFSQRKGVTLFMTLVAASKVVLMRHSGQEDISVGTAIANRTRREIEGLIGFFVNTLVMRTDLSRNPSFSELARREREVALGAYAHQELPFEKLVEEVNPERDLSRSPLFQVMVNLHHAGRETLDLPGVKLSGIGNAVETGIDGQLAKFDLTLSITDFGQGLTGNVCYSRDLFEAGTIERLINHYINVLDGVAKDSDKPIWSLELLSEGEQRQVVEEWNATEAHHPKERLIHELFEEQAERSPDAIAQIYEESSLTYGQLDTRANRLANHLRELGVGPESRVAICMERSLEMLVALLGALKAGAAYLPLDPNYPSERLAYMLKDAQVPVLLSQQRLRENISGLDCPVVYLDSDWEQIEQCGAEPPTVRPQLSNIAYVIFTSGSTGKPKGVAVEHGQILNYVAAIIERLEISQSASFAMVQPLTFDSCATVIYPALATGGCLHVLAMERATDPQAFSEYFSEHEIDLLKITPSHLGAMQTGPTEMDAEKVLPQRWLVIGGESSGAEWVETLRRMKPQCRILSHYGPTEATVGMLTYDVERDRTESYTTVVPVGRPLDNTRAYTLDRWMQPLPAGVGGELHIGGLCVARGYLNHPEITAERFIPDLYGRELGGRLYRTGDQVRRLPDGNIEFLGRLDRQVKIRGFRIELGEIESALLQNKAIREAVVIAAGEEGEEKRLVAYLAPRNGEPLGQGELRSHLKQRLPDYMTPAAFVVMEKLPLMPNGKLDRRALPEPDNLDDARQYEPPTGVTEITLAKIWAEILKLERVSRTDNFFELGGHSLLAVRLIERMRREGLRTNVRAIFTNPTLADLAAVLETEWRL